MNNITINDINDNNNNNSRVGGILLPGVGMDHCRNRETTAINRGREQQRIFNVDEGVVEYRPVGNLQQRRTRLQRPRREGMRRGIRSRHRGCAERNEQRAIEPGEARNHDDAAAQLCIICEENVQNVVYLHGFTAHGGSCLRCATRVADTVGNCPMCNSKIERIVRLY